MENVVENYSSGISEGTSFSIGRPWNSLDYSNIIVGAESVAIGNYNHNYGENIIVKGDYNEVKGKNNNIKGNYNKIYGENIVAKGNYLSIMKSNVTFTSHTELL
jgi:hypothetical protein